MNKHLMMICVAVVALGAMSPMAVTADVAELTLAIDGDSATVVAQAGALDPADTRLYLVWDAENKGVALSAWANSIECTDTLSSDAATYTFDISGVGANSVMRALAVTDVRLIDGYVRLAANQYIDTGISAANTYGFDITYQNVSTSLGNSNYASLMGGVLDDFTVGRYYKTGKSGYNRIYLRWRGDGHTTEFSGLGNSTETNNVSVAGGKAYLGETVKISNLESDSAGTIDKSILLGTAWSNVSPYTGLSKNGFFPANWFHASLSDAEGNALVDLVPALRGDVDAPTAVFYDAVSGGVFANSGTGGALEYDTSATVTNTLSALCAASAIDSNVASATWSGGGTSASTGESANWNPGLPGSAATATIGSTAAGKTPCVPPAGATCAKLYLGSSNSATLVQEHGTVEVTSQHPVYIGYAAGGYGVYNISGGTLSCPDTGDSCIFVGHTGGEGCLNISGTGLVDCQKICLGTTKSGSTKPKGRLAISGDGKLNVRNDSYLGNTDNGGSEIVQSGGTYAGGHDVYLSQGTVAYTKTAGAFTVANDLQIGRNKNATATLTHNGGEMEVARDMIVGGGNNDNKGGVGTLVLGGGSIVVTRYAHIGGHGTGTFTQTGGSFQCNNWTAIGRWENYTGNCTVGGGTFTVNNPTAGLNIGEAGTGTLTVGGTGVVSARSGVTLGAKSGASGTLYLKETGRLVAKTIKKGSGEAALVEFDGGTIQATAAGENILDGLGNIVLKSGGVTIDTQGNDVVISNCVFNVENGGKITATGGGTVTFTDVALVLSGSPQGKVVFAERSDEGVFEGVPACTRRGVSLSADGKKIRIVPRGLIISVY